MSEAKGPNAVRQASNAFSSPDIVICYELDEMLRVQGVPGAMMFVFLHEVSHSLLNVWDYPLYDYHQPYGTGYALMALSWCREKLPAK